MTDCGAWSDPVLSRDQAENEETHYRESGQKCLGTEREITEACFHCQQSQENVAVVER